jgi:hypothetical protein
MSDCLPLYVPLVSFMSSGQKGLSFLLSCLLSGRDFYATSSSSSILI